MDCAVYDTYVQKKDGKIMHFDVVVADDTPQKKAIEYGKQYLQSAGQEGQKDDSGRMSVLPYSTSSALCRENH